MTSAFFTHSTLLPCFQQLEVAIVGLIRNLLSSEEEAFLITSEK
jgi:hypothetical protein